MQLHKVSEHADMPVFADLQDLMEKIFHKVPSISYESDDWETFRATDMDIEKRITKVKVFNGHEKVGELRVVRENFRNQGTVTVYRVKSPHIKNRIGSKDVKATTNPKTALNAAVKNFGRTSTSGEIIEHVSDAFQRNLSNIVYTANRNVERMGDHCEVDLIEYAFAVRNGTQFDTSRLNKLFNHKDADKLIDTRRITASVDKDFKSGSGLVVKEERDGTLTAINMNITLPIDIRVTRHTDSYGLPELYQPKLAMLRMLEKNQPVESIGVKLFIDNTNWYYLTGGEIITTS